MAKKEALDDPHKIPIETAKIVEARHRASDRRAAEGIRKTS